jgi:ribosomal protein L11 methyltransferase
MGKNFEADVKAAMCYASSKTDAEFDILIEPKMSFGTGHHETTHMMIQHLLETEVTGMKTLDMGCGTV